MTNTEEYKLIKEYLDNRNTLIQQYAGSTDSQRCQEGLKLLEQEYARLLKRQRTQAEKDPSKKLKLLQKRLEDMFQLLSLWTQYVEVIYMPESEIHVLSAIQNMEARPEDAAYGLRTQEAEIKNRINTLFSHKEEDERIGGADEEKPADEEYETVNEGMTTDTTEAP
jgi:hypothetical protein